MQKMSARAIGSVIAVVAAAALSGAPADAQTAGPKPSHPLVISVIDVAGDLQLSQPVLEKFRTEHPDLISRFVYTQATAPELAAKLKAQEDAGRLDIDLVLTGNDALAAGMDMGLWLKILPTYQARFSDLLKNYLPGAREMQDMAHGQALLDDWTPSGPLLEYDPTRVKSPPTSAAALLAWCQAHPGRFMYARPANSGPGRTFVMGLPYLLGDKDPSDPVNGWDKTWAYLKELNQCIAYYPAGTGETLKELGQGSRDIIAITTGFDVNARYLGIIPQGDEVGTLTGFHWVGDGNYLAIPKGVAAEKVEVLLELMAFILQPPQQAYMFDDGYMYPGPAITGVSIEMAPNESQDTFKTFGRSEYNALIANNPVDPPLAAKPLVEMFDKWDREIGGTKSSQ
jgi:putative spermidine/putrescine transport system substrate-binding protein